MAELPRYQYHRDICRGNPFRTAFWIYPSQKTLYTTGHQEIIFKVSTKVKGQVSGTSTSPPSGPLGSSEGYYSPVPSGLQRFWAKPAQGIRDSRLQEAVFSLV